METNQERDRSTILAFRLPNAMAEELMSRKMQHETKSVLLRRVVDTFLRKTKKRY